MLWIRCVWANKVTFAGICMLTALIPAAFALALMLPLERVILVCLLPFWLGCVLAIGTVCGMTTMAAYIRTTSILETGHKVHAGNMSYCYRAGYLLAHSDFAKKMQV